jgi:hypothetical protein
MSCSSLGSPSPESGEPNLELPKDDCQFEAKEGETELKPTPPEGPSAAHSSAKRALSGDSLAKLHLPDGQSVLPDCRLLGPDPCSTTSRAPSGRLCRWDWTTMRLSDWSLISTKIVRFIFWPAWTLAQ